MVLGGKFTHGNRLPALPKSRPNPLPVFKRVDADMPFEDPPEETKVLVTDPIADFRDAQGCAFQQSLGRLHPVSLKVGKRGIPGGAPEPPLEVPGAHSDSVGQAIHVHLPGVVFFDERLGRQDLFIVVMLLVLEDGVRDLRGPALVQEERFPALGRNLEAAVSFHQKGQVEIGKGPAPASRLPSSVTRLSGLRSTWG
jgi:hypothetical protein